MSGLVVAGKIFTIEDQLDFSGFSADENPIHVDPLTARRSLAGGPVVHGIHLVLWSLDAVCGHLADLSPITALRVNFEKIVTTGIQVEAVLVDRKVDRIRVEARVDGRAAVVIIASLSVAAARGVPFRHDKVHDPRQPLENTMESMVDMVGRVPPSALAAEASHRFPALTRNIGPYRVSGLCAATYIVGMVCPGLFSIFRSLDLSAIDTGDDDAGLNFEVSSVDQRFQLARLAVCGLGWIGKLDAHLRPKPVAQPSLAEVGKQIRKDEFVGVNALIVGGSRGLGELLAKILAFGGAAVTITYRTGEADALGVQAEIAAAGGLCEILRYDVTADAPEILGSLPAKPNQLYFMASPQIRPNAAGTFSYAQFTSYADYYVHAFSRVVFCLAKLAGGEVSLFYPSTIFVDEPKQGFFEYTAAKAAGENLCHGLALQNLVKKVVVNRLPRLLTDQTRGLSDEEFPDSTALLLSIARSLN